MPCQDTPKPLGDPSSGLSRSYIFLTPVEFSLLGPCYPHFPLPFPSILLTANFRDHIQPSGCPLSIALFSPTSFSPRVLTTALNMTHFKICDDPCEIKNVIELINSTHRSISARIPLFRYPPIASNICIPLMNFPSTSCASVKIGWSVEKRVSSIRFMKGEGGFSSLSLILSLQLGHICLELRAYTRCRDTPYSGASFRREINQG